MENKIACVQGEFFETECMKGNYKEKENISEDKSTRRIKAVNRQQMYLRMVEVEKLVEEDHEVRAIWELTGKLDLSQYYASIKVMNNAAGRSASDPRVLISIWIYSYSKGISSAREITRLSEYDPAYQWLTGMEPINYHTLSDFRVDHQGALTTLFTQVLGVLSAEGLVTLEHVMHDGTKIKACASSDTFRREERIKEHLKIAKEQIERMGDPREAEEVSPRITKARERAVREKKERLECALRELEKIRASKTSEEEKAQARVSQTDPQARIMKQNNGGYGPSYNVQISTDAKEKIIVGVGISQSANDCDELMKAKERIEENVQQVPGKMVVDGGFISRENIVKMHDAKNGELIGPIPNHKNQSQSQLRRRGVSPDFDPHKFMYDAVTDIYICPNGKLLRYDGKEQHVGRMVYKYRCNAKDCQGCTSKQFCCPKNETKGRSLVRSEESPEITSFIEKMQTQEAKDIYKRRGEVAEFPNLWIKSKIKLQQFRVRGLLKTGMETTWACLTYNISQWIRLCWIPQRA